MECLQEAELVANIVIELVPTKRLHLFLYALGMKLENLIKLQFVHRN